MGTRPKDSSEVNHTKMSPLSLILFFSCLCLFTEGKDKMADGQQVERQQYRKLKTTSEQAKKSQTNKVGHRNKWFLIETANNEEGGTTNNEEGANNEEGGDYGEDYQVPAPCGYEIRPQPNFPPCPPGTEITTRT